MVRSARAGIAAAACAVLVAAGYFWTRGGQETPFSAPPERTRAAAETELPRIDLARLGAEREKAPAGRRNIFGFGEERPPQGTAGPIAMPPPALAAAPTPVPVTLPPQPAVPSLNVKYIGSLENKTGLRVAILITDRKEILTGQAGEMVANRFRIVKIGYESVDIQDLGSDRVRRIPYKGN
jgi:hypothetical protein